MLANKVDTMPRKKHGKHSAVASDDNSYIQRFSLGRRQEIESTGGSTVFRLGQPPRVDDPGRYPYVERVVELQNDAHTRLAGGIVYCWWLMRGGGHGKNQDHLGKKASPSERRHLRLR